MNSANQAEFAIIRKVAIRSTLSICLSIAALVGEIFGWLAGDPVVASLSFAVLWAALLVKTSEARVLLRALESAGNPRDGAN